MRATTARRLMITLLVIVLASLSVFFIHRYQVSRMDRSVLDRAAQAEKAGLFNDAIQLYQEHLEVFPDDQDVMLRLAEVLRQGTPDEQRIEYATNLYERYLDRFGSNEKVRDQLVEIYMKRDAFTRARPHLEILVRSQEKDPRYEFYLGRCQEAANDLNQAIESYRAAIAADRKDAPHRLETFGRLAVLLRKQSNRSDEADRLIDQMVRSDPSNYRAYLERGNYHYELYRFKLGNPAENLKAAADDFQLALKRESQEPEIYLRLSQVYSDLGNKPDAIRVLEDGLKVLSETPEAWKLHQTAAMTEFQSGALDKAISRLHASVALLPDQVNLHWVLANLLAERGATSELRVQIEELKRLRYNSNLIDFLEAYYQANSREWMKARQLLIKIQSFVAQDAVLRSRVNNLLATCYGQLGDTDRQREAYEQALASNDQLYTARLGLARSFASRGEFDRAIAEYRKLVGKFPQIAAAPLIRLLIARNAQASSGQKNWSEVEKLLKDLKESASAQPTEPILLQADLFMAQDRMSDARKLLDDARKQFPKNAELWLKSADLMRRQRNYKEAHALLDQAVAIQDSIDLRLERARVLIAQGGGDLSKNLSALAENTSQFSRGDRRQLLSILAQELGQLDDVPAANKLWLELASLNPQDLEPRERMLELAFKGKDEAAIREQIEQIKKINGSDGANARYQEVRFAIWRSQNSTNPEEQASLRKTANSLVADLNTRHPDSPLTHLAAALLDEQEIAQPDIDPERKKAKQSDAATHYLQAMERGFRTLPIIRRTTDLLYASGRSAEVTQLWDSISSSSSMGSLQQAVAVEAIRNKDYDEALKIAEKAVAANPNDFQEQVRLIQVLVASNRLDEAEARLRQAVSNAPAEPERWLTLVQFLIAAKKPAETVEKAARDAESALQDQSPIVLARCSELVGQAYRRSIDTGNQQKAATWNNQATQWYRAARNAKPDDPAIARQLIEFLIRTNQLADVETQLTAILAKNRGADPKSLEEAAWARRTLALALLNNRDYDQRLRAMDVIAPIVNEMKKAGAVVKPEDQRIVARIYIAQKTPEYEARAREILERLVASDGAAPEDHLLLAQIYETSGDWPKAHQQYQLLIRQTENAKDPEIANRRPEYLIRFASGILRAYENDKNPKDLPEAQQLVEKLRVLQPSIASPVLLLSVISLEAQLYKAQNQDQKAVELIQATANRPNLPDEVQRVLAKLAEEVDQQGLAEQILKNLVQRSDQAANRLALAVLLARRDRMNEALDQCEQLWKATTNPEELITGTMEVLHAVEGKTPDPAQVERVASWIQKGLDQKPKSSALLTGLASLREMQGKYQEATELYRRDISQGGGGVATLNNLAWLMALTNEKPGTALELISRAISRGGPLPTLLDTRGVVYLKAGDTPRAIEDLERASSLDPTGAKYFHLSQAYLQAGKKDAAIQALAKSRTKGLKLDLHALEMTAYQQILSELGQH